MVSLLHFLRPKSCILTFLIKPMHAIRSTNLMLLDSITLIIFGEAYRLRISSLCSLLQPPATSSLLGPNILLSTCFQTPSIHVPLLVWGTNIYSLTKQQVQLWFRVLPSLSSYGWDGKTKDSELNGRKRSQNLHFFVNPVLICYCCSQVLKTCHIFEEVISSH
jgi:hypothetical protein